MSDLSVQIKTLLSPTTQADLQSQLDSIAKRLKLTIENVNIIGKQLAGTSETAFNKTGQSVAKYTDEINKLINSANIDKFSEKIVETADGSRYIAEQMKLWNEHLGKTIKQTEIFDKETQGINKTVFDITNNYQKQRAEIEKINKEQSKYWSQRVKEQMGLMVQKPDDLKKMAGYYKEMQKASTDFFNKNISTIDYQIKKREIEGKIFSQTIKGRMQAEVIEQRISEQYHKQEMSQKRLLENLTYFKSKESAFIREDDLKKLSQLEASLKSLDPKSKNFDRNLREYGLELDKVKNNVSLYKQEVQKASTFTGIFGQSVLDAAKKFTTWYLLAGVVTGFIRSLKNGIKTIVDLNKTMTEISVVTGMNQKEVANLAKEYQELGKSVNIAASEIATGATEFYRQGLKEQVMNKLIATTKYAKISNLEFTESAEILTATVNSMNIDIKRASDVFAFLGDATATGADEIGQAFQRVGGTAGALGVEFEKVSSWIAVISSKTRESASSIGDSLKATLARIQNLKKYGFDEEDGTKVNEVARALKEAGIALIDSTGQFRNLGIVMDELGEVWDGLDSRQKAYIATTVNSMAVYKSSLIDLDALTSNVEGNNGASVMAA